MFGSNSTPSVVANICAANLRILACLFIGFAMSMVLGQIPVGSPIGRDCHPNRCGDQAVSLICFRSRHDTKRDFTGVQHFSPRVRGTIFAIRRKNRRHRDEITIGDAALRKACSKEASFSLWTPTPRVRNICVGTIVSTPYFVRHTWWRGSLLTEMHTYRKRNWHRVAVVSRLAEVRNILRRFFYWRVLVAYQLAARSRR